MLKTEGRIIILSKLRRIIQVVLDLYNEESDNRYLEIRAIIMSLCKVIICAREEKDMNILSNISIFGSLSIFDDMIRL